MNEAQGNQKNASKYERSGKTIVEVAMVSYISFVWI
jgi:uncharacterized protein YkuJ